MSGKNRRPRTVKRAAVVERVAQHVGRRRSRPAERRRLRGRGPRRAAAAARGRRRRRRREARLDRGHAVVRGRQLRVARRAGVGRQRHLGGRRGRDAWCDAGVGCGDQGWGGDEGRAKMRGEQAKRPGRGGGARCVSRGRNDDDRPGGGAPGTQDPVSSGPRDGSNTSSSPVEVKVKKARAIRREEKSCQLAGPPAFQEEARPVMARIYLFNECKRGY